MKDSDTQLNQLFDAMADVSLSDSQKTLLKEKLVVFADAHPLTDTPTLTPAEFVAPVPSPFVSRFATLSSFASFAQRKSVMTYAAAAFVFVCVLVGSTSAAAQNTLPGDILYSIKVLVNEPINLFFSIGAKSHAITEASRVDVRLREAEQLSVQNKLSTTTQVTVKEGLAVAAQKAAGSIAELTASGDTEDATEVSATLTSTLARHRDALIELSQKEPAPESELLTDLAQTVTVHLNASVSAAAVRMSAAAISTTSVGLTATSTPLHVATTTPATATSTRAATTTPDGAPSASFKTNVKSQ